MENGIAYVSNKIGKIVTQRPPTSVRFDADQFDKIYDKQPVNFRRSPGSDWAVHVEPAQEVMPLMSLAGPPEALTRKAHTYLLARVTKFVAASRAAPTDGDRREVMERAEAAVSAIAQLPPGGNARIGLPAVRKALDKLVPRK